MPVSSSLFILELTGVDIWYCKAGVSAEQCSLVVKKNCSTNKVGPPGDTNRHTVRFLVGKSTSSQEKLAWPSHAAWTTMCSVA